MGRSGAICTHKTSLVKMAIPKKCRTLACGTFFVTTVPVLNGNRLDKATRNAIIQRTSSKRLTRCRWTRRWIAIGLWTDRTDRVAHRPAGGRNAAAQAAGRARFHRRARLVCGHKWNESMKASRHRRSNWPLPTSSESKKKYEYAPGNIPNKFSNFLPFSNINMTCPDRYLWYSRPVAHY